MKYLLILLLLLPCAALAEDAPYTADTPISDVVNDPVFGDYGRLIFPVAEWYYSGETLGQLRLTWYSNIQPDKTVEIVNYMHDYAEAGNVIFFDIYTEAEKAADPAKRDTGLFFFRGGRERSLPSAMQAAALPMWGQCTTASPMRWS